MQADAEDDQEAGAGDERGPENALARGFAEGDGRHDPEIHDQSPSSRPMTLTNNSSSDMRWGVNSKISAPEPTRWRRISGKTSRDETVKVSWSLSKIAEALQGARPSTMAWVRLRARTSTCAAVSWGLRRSRLVTTSPSRMKTT